jgi:mannose-6-phosphate isomerase-like protein (cupin superfamily)
MRVVNLADKFRLFADHWSPKIVGRLNDFHVKLVKVEGEFVWHHHESEDELFLVVAGELRMKLRENGAERTEIVRPGEFIIIPHGTEHCPTAAIETEILLLEPASTVNTGTAGGARTVRELESI